MEKSKNHSEEQANETKVRGKEGRDQHLTEVPDPDLNPMANEKGNEEDEGNTRSRDVDNKSLARAASTMS